MILTISYLVYLLASIGMTIWVANTLSTNGKVFLIRCFGQDEALANSTNHLLVVGFYLINVGFIAVRLQNWDASLSATDIIPYAGSKIGLSVLILGAMHFFNMMMISRFGKTVAQWASSQDNGVTTPAQAGPEPSA